MTPEEIIARAAPPPERADARRFAPIATDPGSLARRHAGLREAFGSDAALAAHAESLGLTADAWRGRFGDVRLAGPPPDWAETFLAVHERLRAAPPRPGAALGEWMRAELEAGWPAGLPRAPGALDGPVEHLRKRMDNAAFGCLHAERKLGIELAWPERFRRHPALAYVFGRALRDCRDDLLRIAARAAADRALLARALFGGADPGELRGLVPGLGDPHAGGRSVAFLDFARGRVVYKPKDLRIAGLVGELARALDVPGVETTDLVLRDGYAWERAYEARPLAAPGEADGFFRALGAWQALLQALGGNDFWFDNLLADGAVPRFLDYETAAQPETPWPGAADLPDEVTARLRLLPGATGVLPFPWAVGDGVDPTDIGCLARPGRHRSPLPDVERGGAFSWEASAFAPRGADGAPQDAADHYAAFEAGHDRAAEVLSAPGFRRRAEELLLRYADAPARVIRIDTWSCYRCIQRSCAPPRLADGVWREIDLHTVLRNWPDLRGEAREAAVRDMRRLDVPLYQARLGGRDLLGTEGERAAGFFERDAIAAARRRMRDFAALDDAERRAWLRSSFALRPGNPPRRTPSPPARTAASPADLLDWAAEIADFVARLAVRGHGGAPGWLGVVDDVHTGVRRLGVLAVDVLSGRAGLAWALRDLAGPLGRPELAELARETLAGAARDFLDDLRRGVPDGAGFGVGAGGLVAALAGDEELRTLALETHDAAAERQVWMRSGADYVSGLEGWREAARALGRPEPERHGTARPYAPGMRPRLAHWLEAEGPRRPRTAPLCAGRRAAAARRRDRERHGSWFAAEWLDDRHNLSGVYGLPALAVRFLHLAGARAGGA